MVDSKAQERGFVTPARALKAVSAPKDTAFRLYVLLCAAATRDGSVVVNEELRRRLARSLRVSRRTIFRSLRQLRELQFIEWRSRNHGVYRIPSE